MNEMFPPIDLDLNYTPKEKCLSCGTEVDYSDGMYCGAWYCELWAGFKAGLRDAWNLLTFRWDRL